MELRLARTNAEAYLYMELHPCENCGESKFSPDSSVVLSDGDLASQYAGPCPGCRTPREFTFRIPQDVILPVMEELTFGGVHPSQLLDAGQWLWVADRLTRNVPADPHGGMTAQQRRQARDELLTAAAAIGEALKFLPYDADAVPADALWSDIGRAVYEAEPGRFGRRRMDAVQRIYRKLADRFTE